MKPKRIKNIRRAEAFFTRLVGLMGRRKWPSGREGLFFPRCRSLHTFFTFLKPDLVFVDKNGRILEIIVAAGPWRVFNGPRGSVACLELPRGRAKRLGIRMKDLIIFV